MKTILWVCNSPLPEIQSSVGIRSYNEGWLIGMSNQLRNREDIIFHYSFPQYISKRTVNRTIDGITFWGFYSHHNKPYCIEKENIKKIRSIIQKIKPDIIHIFGTELPHALECMSSIVDKSKTIISIQGITSEIAKVYVKGIFWKDRFAGSFLQNKYRCILREQYEFYRRGINEKKILSNAENVIGRTDWDRKCIGKINSGCRYYHCNETLRGVFYDGVWDIEKIRKYSIFVSQANYSIKGLHMLIYALPLIKKDYPDVMVYVGGQKEFLDKNTPYGRFIKKILAKYHVEENVIFLGYSTDEVVKQRLLNAHVMLMPSLVENSPNSIGEAMLLGTPVVASNVGGIPSILHNGVDGYLYACMNTRELADKICKIFKNDTLAMKFSRNGRKFAKLIYDKKRNMEQLLDIYNQVMEC